MMPYLEYEQKLPSDMFYVYTLADPRDGHLRSRDCPHIDTVNQQRRE